MPIHYLTLIDKTGHIVVTVGRYYDINAAMSAGMTHLERGWEEFRTDTIWKPWFRISLDN